MLWEADVEAAVSEVEQTAGGDLAAGEGGSRSPCETEPESAADALLGRALCAAPAPWLAL